MLERLKISSQKVATYGLILVLGLPLSLFLGTIGPAQASEKSVSAEAVEKSVCQKTVFSQSLKQVSSQAQSQAIVEAKIAETNLAAPEKKVTTPVVASKMSFAGLPSGLHRGNAYVEGQSLSFSLNISGKPSVVWAEIGVLDKSFPEIMYLQNQGGGDWFLKTPKLSEGLNLGTWIVNIYAQDDFGQLIKTQLKISLQAFTPLKIVSYKVSLANSAQVEWTPVSWADAYLVNWQIQDDPSSNLSEIVKTNLLVIKDLIPGTFYEVKVQPLRGDAVGQATKIYFKTLGEAPIKEVAGDYQEYQEQPAPVAITPAIGGGVTTYRRVAVETDVAPPVSQEETQEPTEAVSPTPSPEPEEEDEDTESGDWNKLLVALSILIIAAAAAVGGYYGYEWLMCKGKDKDEEPPKSSSRW